MHSTKAVAGGLRVNKRLYDIRHYIHVRNSSSSFPSPSFSSFTSPFYSFSFLLVHLLLLLLAFFLVFPSLSSSPGNYEKNCKREGGKEEINRESEKQKT